jgi:hypothetical protein
MIRFIGTSITSFLNHTYYSAVADLNNLQFTVAHALGFCFHYSVSWQRILTQKLALQLSMKSCCHFLFNNPGPSELTKTLLDSLHWSKSESSQSYFTTSGLPPASLSWRQAPWDSRPEIFSPQLNPCGNSLLFDEKTGLSLIMNMLGL